MPVLFESFLDSTLGYGELDGFGLVLPFLVVVLGAWVLSEDGGPGGAVLASLFSGPPSAGPPYGGVLASFGGLRVNGSGVPVFGVWPFDKLRVNGSGVPVFGVWPFDKLRVNGRGPSDRLRVNGSGSFGGLRMGSFDRLGVEGMGSRLRGNDGCVGLGVEGMGSRLRGNDG